MFYFLCDQHLLIYPVITAQRCYSYVTYKKHELSDSQIPTSSHRSAGTCP